jgi:hypothetical protein
LCWHIVLSSAAVIPDVPFEAQIQYERTEFLNEKICERLADEDYEEKLKAYNERIEKRKISGGVDLPPGARGGDSACCCICVSEKEDEDDNLDQKGNPIKEFKYAKEYPFDYHEGQELHLLTKDDATTIANAQKSSESSMSPLQLSGIIPAFGTGAV